MEGGSWSVVLFDAVCNTAGGQHTSWVDGGSWVVPPDTTVLRLAVHVTPAELRSSKQRGSRAAAKLVAALQAHQQQHPQLVLVAHGVGGLLLKEVCLRLQDCASDSKLPASQRQQYAATLHSIRGLVFLSTPHQPVPRLALPEYEYLLPDMAAVCRRFAAVCSERGWRTLGIGAAVQLDPCRTVPLSAAAKGMGSFVAVQADQHSLCRPDSSSHPAAVVLQRFLQQLRQGREGAAGAELPCGMLPIKLRLLQRLVAAS